MKWTSPFSAMRGSDALFPDNFGEDLLTMIEAGSFIRHLLQAMLLLTLLYYCDYILCKLL